MSEHAPDLRTHDDVVGADVDVEHRDDAAAERGATARGDGGLAAGSGMSTSAGPVDTFARYDAPDRLWRG